MTMFNSAAGGSPLGLANPLFKLEYPQSIGVFASYDEAQRAVDALADQNFPVANLAIVGTDLKLVERVTGRRTWGTVLLQGFWSGLSTALMIAMILFLLDPTRDFVGLLLEALVIGVLIGVVFAVIGQGVSRGRRDFTSVSQTIPSKFEILCEHKVAAQARDLLARTPAGRTASLQPQPGYAPGYPAPGAPGPQGYPQQGYPQPGYQSGAYPVPGAPGAGSSPYPPAPAPQAGRQGADADASGSSGTGSYGPVIPQNSVFEHGAPATAQPGYGEPGSYGAAQPYGGQPAYGPPRSPGAPPSDAAQTGAASWGGTTADQGGTGNRPSGAGASRAGSPFDDPEDRRGEARRN